MDLFKSLPYAIAAYVVIAVVLTTYFGSLLWRMGNTQKEIDHIEGLASQGDSDIDKNTKDSE